MGGGTVNRRGNFHTRYALDQSKLDHRHDGWRLLDCLLTVVPQTHAQFFDDAISGEFAVLDTVTMEKAFFEMPHGCTPEKVTNMAQSHFAATAHQIAPKLWIV